ncbi:methionine sulfoxide reductase [Platysternon megacephalum]|uniref:NADH dehydrogenase [ubiquinone] iron-sulfur protein 2, mitochondrial n=1 Tax=Platysternon megacephalum TaxID=55544 RepID=A0A4D9DI77_9SAUR|nr:methionine sulfoxide reductase [Platysternon megacephalum]
MSVSGVHYPHHVGAELHVVYQLLSYTHNRRISLEVTCPDADPHVPSVVSVYPMADYHERETWDMFGVIFDGHPSLTRILMPDDWQGHPQRKDYPLGGPGENRGQAYYAQGGDFDDISRVQADRNDDIMVINFGPHHPSTHGVLRLVLELEGETVVGCRPGIGFLHTGIEKSMEFRTFTQGTTLATRMNYVASMLNEASYCLAVDRLLDIEHEVPRRAQDIRVLMCELQRIASHFVAVGSGALEIAAMTPATLSFRERDMCLDVIEAISGLRMNQGFIRPGGVANDLPEDGISRLRTFIDWMHKHLGEYADMLYENPIIKSRLVGKAYMDLSTCMALGVTGPALRAAGLEWDLRKKQPYFGYETYEFDVPTWDTCDAYARFRIRMDEIHESLRIVEQCTERLENSAGEPVMHTDPKIGWPASLSLGGDGMGNSNEHIKHIMGESMEALIHHFKLVTEGFKVPPGQVYAPIEGAGGELGIHLVSDGGTRPYRSHMRDPGFNHIQCIPAMVEGGMISDIVVAMASIDPVMGGVDR